jgi:hypothetical protein
MMRVLVIVGTLLLGLVGLTMSLCGGGVLIMTISDPELGSVLLIAVTSLLLGIFFVSVSVVIWRKKLDRDR